MRFEKIAAVLLAASMLAGCTSNEVEQAPEVSIADDMTPAAAGTKAQETTASSSVQTTTSVAATTEITTTPAPEETADTAETEPAAEETSEPYVIDYSAYEMREEESEYISRSIFIGDSICRGFSAYNIVNSDRVYARGNLGARTFSDYKFYYYTEENEELELTYADVLEKTTPDYVFLSMGMNDINMTNEDTFCKNYSAIIDETLAETDAYIMVCAITPIRNKFATPQYINGFNEKLQAYIGENYPERVYYVDFGKHLAAEDGKLREVFHSGDGIHLAPFAYEIALWEMSRVIFENGIEKPIVHATAEAAEDTAEHSAETASVTSETTVSESASTESVSMDETAGITVE